MELFRPTKMATLYTSTDEKKTASQRINRFAQVSNGAGI